MNKMGVASGKHTLTEQKHDQNRFSESDIV